MTLPNTNKATWPVWKRLLFRFFFIYLLFAISPWLWLDFIPGIDRLSDIYSDCMHWLIDFANAKFFHVKPVLSIRGSGNGSGDTSRDWAYQCLLLSFSVIGLIIWTIADRKNKEYNRLNYWTILFVRYNIISVAVIYGIIKVLVMQMPAPNATLLSTPVGDFSPMRLLYVFMGSSKPYEILTGVSELLIVVLMLWRRTTTLGIFLSLIVFSNVVIFNLDYNICVKIFALQLLLFTLYLLANESERLINFFILNKPAAGTSIYDFPYTSRRMRILRIVLKLTFIFGLLYLPLYTQWNRYKARQVEINIAPFKKGIYDVSAYVVNKDTIPALITDSLRWQNMIFDDRTGSVQTKDKIFRQSYNRAIFGYSVDSAKQLLVLMKGRRDTTRVISLHYSMIDANTILLNGKRNNDSLFITLKRNDRHFLLPERGVSWIMEESE